MKNHLIPLLAVLASAALAMALIHFWLAAFLSSITHISYSAMYGYLTTLLILLTAVRILATLKDSDCVAMMIDRWIKRPQK